MVLLTCFDCKAQTKQLTGSYIGNQYKESKNKNFISNELMFSEGIDTIRINIKIPFNRMMQKL